jgi:hypothetical protein
VSTPLPNFDLIARSYRWLEYVTFGRALERCRFHFLPRLTYARRALILGDGDGRFTSRLLAQNPVVQVTAVDTSASMLRLLESRCAPFSSRLSTRQTDALTFTPSCPCDLICTHFFLDCLTQREVEALIARLALTLRPKPAYWLISDFRIPPFGSMHWPARLLVRELYLAFRVLTGLRVRHLPDHASALARAGFNRVDRHLSLGGLLATELWQTR